MLYAQTGIDKALDVAAKGGGWEPVALVVILGSFLLAIGFIAKWFIASFDKQLDAATKREDRLSARVTELEGFIRETLLGLIKSTQDALIECKEAINRLTSTLTDKPCLLSEERRQVLVDHIVESIKTTES